MTKDETLKTYKNEEWLREQSIELNRPDRQIAISLNVYPGTISYWRRKYNIPTPHKLLPTKNELTHLVNDDHLIDQDIANKFSLAPTTICRLRAKYRIKALKQSKILITEEDLRNLYDDQHLSDAQIGKTLGVTWAAIYWWRKRYGILARSLPEAQHLRVGNHVDLSPEAIEFISGELLGDGHLSQISPYSASYYHTSQYKQYVEWLSNIFAGFGIQQVGKINKQDNNGTITYHYCSKSYPALQVMRKQWYPEGKKIVPKTLSMTPLVLRQHFLGDGGLHKNKRGGPTISLYTNGFTHNDVMFLRKLLTNIGINTNYHQSDNTIYVPVSEVTNFLKYIGQCPDPIRWCYQYKWDTTRTRQEWINEIRPKLEQARPNEIHY